MRDWLIFIFATTALAVSLSIFSNAVDVSSPIFALAAMFVPLGFLRYLYRAAPFGVPNYFDQVRPWKYDKERCRKLGILTFGKVLRNTPLRKGAPRIYLKACKEPAEVLPHAKQAEAIHFWAFVLGMPYLILCVIFSWWSAALVSAAVQICSNIYPFFHLRYTRSRLLIHIGRSKSAECLSSPAGAMMSYD